MRRRVVHLAVVAVSLHLAATVLADAVPPREALAEALRFVPHDAVAVLTLEDLAGHAERFRASSWWRALETLPTLEPWRKARDTRLLPIANGQARYLTGFDLGGLRDDVFGRAVALSVHPATGGAEDADAGEAEDRLGGLVVCRTTDESVARKVVATMTSPLGRREVEEFSVDGATYYECRERGKSLFVSRQGAVLLLTDDRASLTAALEAGSQNAVAPILSERQSVASPDDRFARLLLDPRKFDPELEAGVQKATGPDRLLAASVLTLWRAVRAIELSMALAEDETLRLGLRVAVDRERLAGLGIPTPESVVDEERFWRLVPAGAVAALGLGVDVAATVDLVRSLSESADAEDVDTAGFLFDELLAGYQAEAELAPRLGPDACLVLLPGSDASDPPALVATLLLRDSQANPNLPLSAALDATFRPMLVLLALEHNQAHPGDPLRARLEVVDGLRLHFLSASRELPWLSPTFAVSNDRLWFGTTPEAVTRMRRSLASEDAALHPASQVGSSALGAPQAFLDVEALVTLATRNEEAIVDALTQGRSNDEDFRNFEILREVAGLAQYVVLRTQSSEALRSWTLELTPAE